MVAISAMLTNGVCVKAKRVELLIRDVPRGPKAHSKQEPNLSG